MFFLLRPVNQPWQILAWFPIGGWDNCPKAEHLVSVAKHWQEGFGAVPAVISDGIIEFAVPKPASVSREREKWYVFEYSYDAEANC